MKLAEYIPLALRTEVPRPILERYLHGTIGVCTEAAELYDFKDETNLKEELGDICWYVAIQFDALSISVDALRQTPEIVYEGTPVEFSHIICLAADSLDVVKKAWFYGRDIDHSKIDLNARMIMQGVIYLAECHGFTLSEVLEANIAKLRVRYPQKFTSEAAIHRDLAAERRVLHA